MRVPEKALHRINEIMADPRLARALRDSLLEGAADDAWNALFPEGVHRVSAAVAMQRWNELWEQLSAYQNRKEIMRIVESRASGERFHWLDSPHVG